MSNSGSSETEAKLRALVRLAKDKISDDVPFDQITKLDLTGAGLSDGSIEDAFAALLPNLSILFLSNNNFRQMPAVIGSFPKLQMVAFKSNQMTSIHPDALQPQLRWLILTDNSLTEIPETIGRCTKLQKFMLSGNQIASLPSETALTNLSNLELIRLASNRLSEPPVQLLQLLPNLRWVALSDNPFLADFRPPGIAEHASNIITDLSDETQGKILGRGAGGVTRQIVYRDQTVAVKQYGGAMTSDGLPAMERQIAVAVSQFRSPAFIHVIGECEGSGSLVMEFLDDYGALAGPPSLESCSRDVYCHDDDAPCHQLTLEEATHLVTVLLEALQQLHAHGISHSDFYGHNILVQRSNLQQVRLSDFGAAFFYDATAEYGRLLQRIELRAFAVLVSEVAEQLLNEGGEEAKAHFGALERECLKPDATFERVDVWWKQRRLADLAKAFGADEEDE